MNNEQLEKLSKWYRDEFKRRTVAIKKGKAKIDWLVPEYRVSRTEVESYAESIGIKLNADDSIQLFHYLNRKD